MTDGGGNTRHDKKNDRQQQQVSLPDLYFGVGKGAGDGVVEGVGVSCPEALLSRHQPQC